MLSENGIWHLDLKNGSGAAGQGEPASGASDVTFVMTSDMFVDMFAGKVNPTTAFMMGKMKIKGDIGKAMKLEKLMKNMKKQPAPSSSSASPSGSPLERTFASIQAMLSPDTVSSIGAVYAFDLKGEFCYFYSIFLRNVLIRGTSYYSYKVITEMSN